MSGAVELLLAEILKGRTWPIYRQELEEIVADVLDTRAPVVSSQAGEEGIDSCANTNASPISAATSPGEATRRDSSNGLTALATELPDNVRIPLHSLQADLEYLIGRVIADGSFGPAAVASMKERLNKIEQAVLASPTPTPGGMELADEPTQEYVLRAMAKNYAGGHCWDHLDGETCIKAADEIHRLRTVSRAGADD